MLTTEAVNFQSIEESRTSDHTMKGSDIYVTDPCTNSQTNVHVQTIEIPTLKPTLEDNSITMTEFDLLERDGIALEDDYYLALANNETKNQRLMDR
ncbi:hypothetical protein EVAR_10957_1 [Eumeta japonica]|uniref:Uncharacterized protein n=1 Tax=Eumeta variegata TaxID=151549 RepID=A0A4C1U671_EUMVA|nr:hypothetical protein EVAR_10957_1 [Eumeta japonica]